MIHKTKPTSDLVARLIESQQELTAVERFTQRHQSITNPVAESHYRDLIPLSAPDAGEQYSFEIDLDACSGCKACVAACHSLNGLEEGEIWRNVGLMTSEEEFNPVVQHVTSACHHCLEPGCMSGCPVRAYEKDPVTGIVEHLDDQCIGCKYCMLTCPYDVPSYSKSKGIVRKCNMCVDRLRVGEAPACVQACPHEAIKIRKVKTADLAAIGEDQTLLPGCPSSGLTKPSTVYKSSAELSAKGLPVDFFNAGTQHAHFPLVMMLVLTQLSFGVFAVGGLLKLFGVVAEPFFTSHAIAGFIALCAGLGLATLHLGRPTKAYRAMSGFRTSWLSREIIGFNAYASAASGLLACCFLFPQWSLLSSAWTVICGAIAVECSVMLYVVTGRPLWSSARTHGLFFLSALVSGSSFTLGLLGPSFSRGHVVAAIVLALGMVAKLFLETRLLPSLSSSEPSTDKLAASLLVGAQRFPAMLRLALGVVGGIVIPTVMMVAEFSGPALLGASVLSALCVIAGEFLERYLFFAVCVARRMPGAPN